MPEIRSVTVRLDADVASYIAKMKAAGKATDDAFSSGPRNISETNTALKDTESELGKVDAQARKVDTSMRGLDQRNQSVARSQDRLTGGMRILVNTALALGPALVPIGALGIPAIAGVAGALGDAVLGVGVAELAFHGLGKALTAFNKAELAPTTANITAARTALDALPPSAQALVLELHKLSPVLDHLRQSAASGIAPGVTAGLRDLLTDAPVVNRAVHGIAGELGDLSAEAGRSLSGPEWRGFIRTVGTQAPQALDQLGHATGSVVHGLAQLYLAFGPSLGSFDAGVVKVARDFDRWAASLGQSQGFQSFLAYVALNGPRVTALLGDTASLLGNIVKAAAPLGGPTLQALDLIVKVLDEIAKSPLGTPLLLLAQINAVLHLTNNLLGVMGVESRIGFSGITSGAAKTEGALSGIRAEASAAGAALRTMFSNVGANSASGRSLLTGVDRGGLASLGKGALLAGGVAAISTGLPSKLGLSNTATLALAGSLGGPLVAGAGAAVGAIIDVSHATDGLAAATHQAQTAVKGWDLAGETQSLVNLQAQVDKTLRAQSFNGSGILGPLKGFQAYGTRINDLFTHNLSQGQSAAQQTQATLDQQKTALALVQQGLQGASLKSFPSDQQLQGTLTRIQPALQALGVTTDQLAASANKGGPAFDKLVGSISHYLNQADSTKGETAAVAAAFANMSNEAVTAADRATALTSSLDALVDPMLTLGGASDTFQQDLNDLGKNLSKTTRSLVGNTDAVIQNRGVVRGAIGDLKAKIEAEANAGASSQRMSATLRNGVAALIAQGRAAGLNTGQIKAMIAEMHLTPKLVKTLFQAETKAALTGIAAVDRAIAGIPRTVPVHINVTRSTNANLAEQGALTNPKGKAGGGHITGAGGPTSDSIPAWLSNGEYVMRAAAVQHYGLGMMHAVNAGRFADGGPVATYASRRATDGTSGQPLNVVVTDGAFGQAINDATLGLKGLRLESSSLTKQLDAEKQQRQQVMQAESQLVSTVRDQFRTQLFGVTTSGSSNIWAPGAAGPATTDPLQILNHNIHHARTYTRDIRSLRRRGLRGDALAQVTTLADAQQALGLSPHELREISRREQVLQHASQRAGQTAGDLRYGKQLDNIGSEIQETNRRLHSVEAAIKHHETEAKTATHQAAAATTAAIGGVARQTVRKANHP